MEAAGTAPAKIGTQVSHASFTNPVVAGDRAHQTNFADPAQGAPKRIGYGLPCSNCGTYYAADRPACPICKCAERVSPNNAALPAMVQEADPLPDSEQLEAERERFLKEFKSQLYSAHMQINASATFRCSREESHDGVSEPAAVCDNCYARVQQRADQMEAALHMDLNEATQIIYEAVWSDPSDPGKTYQNAAQALLTELRQRAGISRVLSTLQPYSH
jgi:hypothetical protein